MFGLGKRRSKFGRWLDKQGVTQLELEKRSKLSRGTISSLCNDDNYQPKHETIIKIQHGLKTLGKNLPNYFDM